MPVEEGQLFQVTVAFEVAIVGGIPRSFCLVASVGNRTKD